MHSFRKTIYVTLGVLFVLLGVVGSFVMFLQPWRSCPEIDDSSAGCPATSDDTALLGLAIAVLLAGIALLITLNFFNLNGLIKNPPLQRHE